MSDRAKQADVGGATLAANVARWSSDPGLAPVFATRSSMMLVLDAEAGHVIGAPGESASLHAAVAGADGSVRPALRLSEQLRSVGPPGSGPRLVRLRFDTRGIARPTSCVAARATTTAGDVVLLLAPTEPLPALRIAAPRPQAAAVPESVSDPEPASEPVAEAQAAPSNRFVWRSDEDGVLTQVSGGSAEISGHLTGRSWKALGESGTIGGSSLLAALGARQTFRALPLSVRPPGSADAIDIELSGAPSARPAQPFAGFSGYGVVRATRPVSQEAVAALGKPHEDEQPSALSELPSLTDDHQPTPPAAIHDRHDAHAAPPSTSAEPSPSALAEERSPEPSDATHQSAAPIVTDDSEFASENEAPAPRGTDLSTHEHAAFREIARALGARFAGDDEAPASDPPPESERRGAVMAFPVSAAQSANAAIDAAIVSALDRLPAGVLVHRDAAILYVNRRFLELTDYPDRQALHAAGALTHLLGTLPPLEDGIAPDTPVSVTTGGGVLLPLLVERSKVDWDGGPAELMLVRAAAQADQTREQIARGLFEARDTERERDAQDLLDHIEEGVATLDETGRILALNGSAKAILSSDAREIVGGALAELFTPESESAVTASLFEAQESGASQAYDATPRVGARTGPLRLRIARLSAANTARFCVTLREPTASTPAEPIRVEQGSLHRADFLARVSEEIRAPIKGILDRTETLLSERHGSMGSERGSEYLREIHQSGEHVLGVVDDLVDLARIEAGRGDLTFTDIALNDVVSGCIALMQPQAERDRIVVRTSLSPDLRPLMADERSMRQATLNVIANAIRLTEAGGQVIVSTTTAERGEIAFRVRDTGIGMTPEEIERALAPFSPGGGAGGRDGTGLGLTLTKALVEANRGRFRITSRKNEGTLVEMLFPSPQALSA